MNIDELKKLAGLPVTEWANSPANTAHPDPEEVAAPEADVSQSLRRYLNADPQPVKVMESADDDTGIIEHTVEDMMANFQKYLAEDEAEAITEKADCECETHENHDACADDCDCNESVTEEESVSEHHQKDAEGNTIPHDDEVTEAVEESADELEEAKIDEEPNEDNAFNSAAANAKKAGKSEFSFNGKKYKVKMDDKTADALTDDINDLRKLAGIGEQTTSETVSADVAALKKLAGI